jgi:peptidoglycan/LPS O-acetylase OafA/YrhL
MSLALIETKRGTLGKRLSLIGDISYSSYLLHFPLILTTVLVTAELGIEQELFNSPWFMILFFLVLVLLCLASHRYFEVPMQRYLRRLDKTAVN